MSALMSFRPLFLCRKCLHLPVISKAALQTTSYLSAKPVKAAAKAKVLSQMTERKRMDVESDPEKLTTLLCGSNYQITGENIKLKPDSEYPDWLWTLRTERGPPALEELDKNTPQYWRILKRRQKEKESLLQKTRHKYKIFKRR